MTKCDFCTKSHEGKCFWTFQSEREADCKEAIELMIKTLSNININLNLVKGEYNDG